MAEYWGKKIKMTLFKGRLTSGPKIGEYYTVPYSSKLLTSSLNLGKLLIRIDQIISSAILS